MPPGKKIDTSAVTTKSTGLAAATSVAVASTAATSTSPFGYAQTQADAIVSNLNKVIAEGANTKSVLAALIEELTARGVLQTLADFLSFNEGRKELANNGLPATCWFLLSTKDCVTHVVGDTLAGGVGEITGTGYARQSEAEPTATAANPSAVVFAQKTWSTGVNTNWPASVKSVVMTTTSDNTGKAICAWNLQTGGTARDLSGANTTENFTPTLNVSQVATTGTATLDFGAFPGSSDTSLAITGQGGIVSGSLVEAWILPAATADHTADEHLIEELEVYAGSIVAGTGFTIYGVHKPGSGDTRLYGTWNIAWVWN